MTKHLVVIITLLDMTASWGQTSLDYDKYGGVLSLKGKKTGWFHVEQIKGRWFFVTPEGNAFFSLGVSHAGECIRLDELNVFATRYDKSESRLSDFFLNQFKEWGYNSSGYGPLPTMESRLPYVATIWTEGPRSFSAGDRSKFTDIFDPAVQERLRRKVREAAAAHTNNPYCLGYVFIDLPVWSVTAVRGSSYVDFVRALGSDGHGKRAYLEFLTQRYGGDTQKFGKAYGIQTASFPALLPADLTGVKARDANVAVDDEAFLNHIANIYYTCVVGELRKCDPHHLILGDRLMALPDRTPNSILVTAAKHVDVISFQPMGTQKMIREYLDQVFQLTGKPILLADVNTMTERPKQGQTETAAYERAAGEHTLKYYLDAANSKYCIGLHRCTVRDYQPWNLQYHRRGLLKADDSPYPTLVDYTQRANRQVYQVVYGSMK
jgi:hypothetical protein